MGSGCSRLPAERHSPEDSEYEDEEDEETQTSPHQPGGSTKQPALDTAPAAPKARSDAHTASSRTAQYSAPSASPTSQVANPMSPSQRQADADLLRKPSKPPAAVAAPAPPATSPTSSQAPRRQSAEPQRPPTEQHASPTAPHAMSSTGKRPGAFPPQGAALHRITSEASGISSEELAGVTVSSGSGNQSTPQHQGGVGDPWSDDYTTQLPRRLQNKAIRSLSLSTTTHTITQTSIIVPALLFGVLGDLRGERLEQPHVTFDMRRLCKAAPVILEYRLKHTLSQHSESITANPGSEKSSVVGVGSAVKPPVFALLMNGPPLFEQRSVRTATQKMLLQKVGMYAASMWMPSTLRKGNRRRQRSQFTYQRELVSVLTHGSDAAAFFVANILPDVFTNLEAFDSNVRVALTASVRATLHKLYEVLVTRDEKMKLDSDGHHGTVLRAPKVDISVVYLRDDILYATTTIGAQEGQLFVLAPNVQQHGKVVALESDHQNESLDSQDDKSISSMASFMSSSSASSRRGRVAKEPKRKYDMPNTTTFQTVLTDLLDAKVSDSSAAASPNTDGAKPRMALFQPQQSLASSSASNGSVDEKPNFAVVLSTEAFWSTISKKEVWDLLFLMCELEYSASLTFKKRVDTQGATVRERPDGASCTELLASYDGSLPEVAGAKLTKFFEERCEQYKATVTTSPERAMAAVLSDVAESKAMMENADHAARMSVTVIVIR